MRRSRLSCGAVSRLRANCEEESGHRRQNWREAGTIQIGKSACGYWIAQYAECDFANKVVELGLAASDRILRYQVEAALPDRHLDEVGRDAWVAYPDWAILRCLPSQPSPMSRAAE